MSRASAYGIAFGVALVVTLALTPLVRLLAIRIGAVVKPDERRVHQRPTPTIGGIAMFGGFAAGFVTAWSLGAFDEAFSGSTEPWGILGAALVMLVIGVVDDLREVSAPAKTAGTVLAASVLVFSGVSILVLRIPLERAFTDETNILYLSSDLSFLLSVIWVVGMAQAVNLIDGLDGLAAGIVGIAAAGFFFFSLRLGDAGLLSADNLGPLVALLILAICLGFLPYNAHPARIFMGDAGADAGAADGGGDDDGRWSIRPAVLGSGVLLLCADPHPAVDPGRPHPRHRLRHRAPRRQALGCLRGGQGSSAPPVAAPRARASPRRVHPVGLDGAARRLRAVPDLHRSRRRARPVRRAGPGPGVVHDPAAPDRSAGQAGRSRTAVERSRRRAGARRQAPAPARRASAPNAERAVLARICGAAPVPRSLRIASQATRPACRAHREISFP
ncbi:MAG: MraY family glycosyltransferase [Acidimicrobiales bacterium]